MIKVISFKFNDRPELASQANAIRQQVFVEEQNVDPALEYDEYEDVATHFLLYVDEKPVATARWRETDKGIKLERFATLKSSRNSGLGAVLLQKIMADIIPSGKKIYLHSQLKAISFYTRHGFVKFGDQFSEAEIEHFKMEYRVVNGE